MANNEELKAMGLLENEEKYCYGCCKELKKEEIGNYKGFCKDCYDERYSNNSKEIEQNVNNYEEKGIQHNLTNNDENDHIHNVTQIISIVGVLGVIGSFSLLFINIELIGICFLGLLATPIAMVIASSELKKENKKTYFYRYKKFINQNGMTNCESISYKNIIGIDIDMKNKLLSTYSYYEGETNILKFEEILDFEIFENGNSVVSSRTGSAVVGGLLFGGLGAVAGASGSRTISDNCSTLKLNIYTNKVQNSVITLDCLEKSIPKTSNEYEQLKDIINRIIGFLKIAREDNRQKERQEDKKVIIENTDEIKQGTQLSSLKELAELKEQGIITDEEFQESKKRILLKL